MGLKLALGLVEFWHLDVDEIELVAEYIAGFLLRELHIIEVFVVGLVLIEDKIQDANRIDGLEAEIPIAALQPAPVSGTWHKRGCDP